jgi:dTDP-glucose 4,6-dehydratase/UDP-glucuronate decarboxylase
MVDYVVHAAGYGQPERFMAQPVATVEVATTGLNRAIGNLKRGGKAIFLSSSEIYSGSKRIPHTELDIGTTRPDHPRACYIEAKRCGEAIVHALRAKGVDAKIARVSLVYGPARWDDKRVMFDFIRQAMTTGVIQLRDQGSAIRTYCYVEDAVTMLLNILMEGKQAVYNVGGVSRVTILELAHMIARRLNAQVELCTQLPLSGAPDEVSVALTRYAHEFGVPEFTPLEIGLDRTIAAMKDQRNSGAGQELDFASAVPAA